jgi:hypothetical protein
METAHEARTNGGYEMVKDRNAGDAEHSLAIRAAWLHYVGGLRQAEVAKRIGVPSVKAHRLIARAVAEGAVKVSIEGEIIECIALEQALTEGTPIRFATSACRSGRLVWPAPRGCGAGWKAARN